VPGQKYFFAAEFGRVPESSIKPALPFHDGVASRGRNQPGAVGDSRSRRHNIKAQ
jgi:hypothetical protein